MVTQIWLEILSPRNLGAPKHEISARFRITSRLELANIFGTQDIVNRKTALQTTDTSAQAYLIECTLVLKWLKIGPEF